MEKFYLLKSWLAKKQPLIVFIKYLNYASKRSLEEKMERLDDLFKLAYGFAVSKIIFTSVKFGIYSKLSKCEKTASELAKELSLPERSFSRLLNSCTALGIL